MPCLDQLWSSHFDLPFHSFWQFWMLISFFFFFFYMFTCGNIFFWWKSFLSSYRCKWSNASSNLPIDWCLYDSDWHSIDKTQFLFFLWCVRSILTKGYLWTCPSFMSMNFWKRNHLVECAKWFVNWSIWFFQILLSFSLFL